MIRKQQARFFVACAASVLATTAGLAQFLPAMIYGDSLDERATALVEGVNPGYCLAGWSRSYSANGSADALMIKTDPLGVPMWSVISSGRNDDEAYSMVRTQDHGYTVTGWTASFGPGIPSRNVFVFKADSAGTQLWGWAYGGPADDEGYSIIETSDRGYAVCGLTRGFGPPPYPNIFVLRLDPGGLPLWFRVYWSLPAHIEDEGYAIAETPDSGLVVVGRAKTVSPALYDPFVLKLGPMGNPQWASTVPGDSGDDEGHSVAVSPAGGILAAGWSTSFSSNPLVTTDLFVAEFTPPGALIWSQCYGWPVGDERVLDDRSLVATLDGGSAVCGPTTSVGPGTPNPNFMVLKLAPGGPPMWCRSHPSPYRPGLLSDVPRPMVELAAGGYAVAGWTNSFPAPANENFHLVTLDASGNRPVCVEPQSPVIVPLPWVQWEFDDSLEMVDFAPMMTGPVEVLFELICQDTTALEEGVRRPVGAFGLAVRGRWLELALPHEDAVTVTAYAADGRARRVIADRCFSAGRHRLDPRGLEPGVYLVRAESRSGSTVAKLVAY